MGTRFKIHVAENAMKSTIELNGEKLSGVRRFTVDVDPKRNETFFRLEIYGEVEIEGEFCETLLLDTAASGVLTAPKAGAQ